MEQTYNLGLVALAYGIAVIAAYTALQMAGRVMYTGSRTLPWIIAGSLTMGTGIWSMHFVGMEALSLPIALAYDIPITALSWAAAVAVSAMALYTLSKGGASQTKWVLLSALFMGLGICTMHYSGMFALRMSPGIQYDTTLLAASFLIAFGASAVTLYIASYLREITSLKHELMRVGAALIMGLAITGMHFVGMFAANFQAGAVCLTENGLQAGWTAGPVTIATVTILAVALSFSFRESRAAFKAERRHDAERLRHAALTDQETGMPNRSQLNHWLSEAVEHNKRTTLLIAEPRRIHDADGNRLEFSGNTAKRLSEALARQLDDCKLARTNHKSLALLVADVSSDDLARRFAGAVSEAGDFLPGWRIDWAVGAATYPDDAKERYQLVRRANADLKPLDGGIPDTGDDELAPAT